MNSLLRVVGLAVVCFPALACVSYTGVTRADGQLYVSGGTSYFFYTAPWVRRCDVDGNQLRCEELTESPSAPRAPRQEKTEGTKPASSK